MDLSPLNDEHDGRPLAIEANITKGHNVNGRDMHRFISGIVNEVLFVSLIVFLKSSMVVRWR